jgi:hypothetical protein
MGLFGSPMPANPEAHLPPSLLDKTKEATSSYDPSFSPRPLVIPEGVRGYELLPEYDGPTIGPDTGRGTAIPPQLDRAARLGDPVAIRSMQRIAGQRTVLDDLAEAARTLGTAIASRGGAVPVIVRAHVRNPCPPTHHIATNANSISSVRGGPWTPRFEGIFASAGMTLQHPANRVPLPGHIGPHPEAYHRTIYERLRRATNGLSGRAYEEALLKELAKLRAEILTPGSQLNGYLTK